MHQCARPSTCLCRGAAGTHGSDGRADAFRNTAWVPNRLAHTLAATHTPPLRGTPAANAKCPKVHETPIKNQKRVCTRRARGGRDRDARDRLHMTYHMPAAPIRTRVVAVAHLHRHTRPAVGSGVLALVQRQQPRPKTATGHWPPPTRGAHRLCGNRPCTFSHSGHTDERA